MAACARTTAPPPPLPTPGGGRAVAADSCLVGSFRGGRDTVRVALLDPAVPAGTYNVASGRTVRMSELVDRLVDLSGLQKLHEVGMLGHLLAEVGAGAVEVGEPQPDLGDQRVTGREQALAELRQAFPPAPGQSGALFALGNERLCLDYLFRPAAFVRLYPKLLDGYLLDALDHLDHKPVTRRQLAGFVASADAAPTRRSPSAGLGDDTRIGTFVELQRGVAIGSRCKISSHTFVCEGVTLADDGVVGHAELELGGATIYLSTPDGYVSPCRLRESSELARQAHDNPWVIDGHFVEVDAVAAHFQRARAAGASILRELEEPGIGFRIYTAEDPEGHRWMFGQKP